MSSALVRPLLRPTLRLRTIATRRFESTASHKTAHVAKEYTSKATDGLSRVTSSAVPAIAGAAKGLSSALGRVGDRMGRFIGLVERQVPFVIYYSKVSLELGKLVFRGQQMNPPSIANFQSYLNRGWSAIKNPGTLLRSKGFDSGTSILQRLRNVSAAQLAGSSVLLAELLGFFTVGEMVGRLKLIGYHGGVAHGHH